MAVSMNLRKWISRLTEIFSITRQANLILFIVVKYFGIFAYNKYSSWAGDSFHTE